MWTAKDRYRNTSTSLYSSVPTPEKPKHHQQQSKLQAALKNTKEHEDTHFYLLTAQVFNPLLWQTEQQITDNQSCSEWIYCQIEDFFFLN